MTIIIFIKVDSTRSTKDTSMRYAMHNRYEYICFLYNNLLIVLADNILYFYTLLTIASVKHYVYENK